VPFADGGAAVVDDSQLRCRAHNQDESERWFSMQEPPVVREYRDVSGWSNSVRTESPVQPHSLCVPSVRSFTSH